MSSKSKQQNTCPICCETFTKQHRKEISCLYCDQVACKSCIETYLTTEFVDANCLFCKHALDDGFIENKMTKLFRNEKLSKHRQIILFDREKAQMPATQNLIEIHKLREVRIQQLIVVRRIDSDIRCANYRLGASIKNRDRFTNEIVASSMSQYQCMLLTHYMTSINRARDELYTLQENVSIAREKLNQIQSQIDEKMGNVEKKERQKRVFIKACPKNDCRGFVTEKWECGLCNAIVCKHCEELKEDDNHECNPDTVETVKLLQKDSKQCPKCPAIIYKIDGCSQMYCIHCHTAFDYNTGRIETGRVHNPEYYRWLREHGNVVPREPGDHGIEDCNNELPRIENVIQFVPEDTNKLNTIYSLHNRAAHLQYHTLVSMQYEIRNQNNVDLRIKYLKGYIGEAEFKERIVKRAKHNRKRELFYNIIELFVNVIKDSFNELINLDITFPVFMEKIECISEYCQKQMDNTDHLFDSSNGSLRKLVTFTFKGPALP